MSSQNHEGHRARLRRRVLETRTEGMAAHEVLEMLLLYAIPMRDVNQLSRALIRKFGSLANVLYADPEELLQVEGMGENTASFLILAGEALEEYALSEPPILNTYVRASAMAEMLRMYPMRLGYCAVCLDARARLQEVSPIAPLEAKAEDIACGLLRAIIRNRSGYVALARRGGGRFTEEEVKAVGLFNETAVGLELLLMDVLAVCDSGCVTSLRRLWNANETPRLREILPKWPEIFSNWLYNFSEK